MTEHTIEQKSQSKKHFAKKEKTGRIRTGELSFSETEFKRLLSVCETMQDEVMLKIGVTLGLRRDDMVRLLVENVDFKDHVLKYVEKKKRGAIRIKMMEPELERSLKMYINSLEEGTIYLFPYGKSKYGDRSMWNRLNELCDKAQVKRREFHALRSTCVKFHQKAGWRPEETAELINDSVQVVLLHYATPSTSELNELTLTKTIL